MSRSGYSDEYEGDNPPEFYRQAVARAIQGKRGQAFLRELLSALDALPEKRLISDELELDGAVCALGAVGKARGMDMSGIDYTDAQVVGQHFGVAWSLAAEIEYMNDEVLQWAPKAETPEERFTRMRKWVEQQLIEWEQPQ